MFYEFRSSDRSPQRILNLLKLVEELNPTTDVTNRIKYHLFSLLLSFFSKQIVGEDKKKIGQCQILLSDSLYFYVSENGGPAVAKLAPFFSELQQLIDKKLGEKSENRQESVIQFVRKQLGLNKMNEKKIGRQQVLFALRHLQDVSAEQLDKFLKWSIESGDTNVAQLVQQIFKERHWKPLWIKIHSNVKEERTREEVELIRHCFEWEHCHLSSYQQKMIYVSQLEEKLRIVDSKQFSELIQQLIMQLRGLPFLKTVDFLDFFRHQLSAEQQMNVNSKSRWETMKETAKGIKDSVISTVIGQQQPEAMTEFILKIRGALYSYHEMIFELEEIRELSHILNELLDVDPRNKQHDLINLKDQHQRHWPTNYLRRWFETKKSGCKELATAVESLFQLVCQMVQSLQKLSDLKEQNDETATTNRLLNLLVHFKKDEELSLETIQQKRNAIECQFMEEVSRLTLPFSTSGPVTLITKLLQSISDEGKEKLKLKAVVHLCKFVVHKPELNAIKCWADSLERFSKNSNEILQIQNALVQLSIDSYRFHEVSDDCYVASHQEQCMETLATMSRFLAAADDSSNYEANRLFLCGLSMLPKQKDCIENVRDFVQKFITTNRDFSCDKKLEIISFIHSEEATPVEVAFLKRWIQAKSSSGDQTVAAIYDATRKKSKSKNFNRFWTKVDDIWTQEEVKYLDIIGKEAANRLLQDKTPEEYLFLLKEAAVQQVINQLKLLLPGEALDYHLHCSRSAAKEESKEYEWVIWLRDVVLQSIKVSSPGCLSSKALVNLFSVTEDHPFEIVWRSTSAARPHQWIDELLVTSVVHAAMTVYGDNLETMETEIRLFIQRCQSPAKKMLHLLRNQLDEEAELKLQKNKDLQLFKQLLNSFKTIDKVPEDMVNRFIQLPLSRWPKRMRHLLLSQQWSKGLAIRLVKLDNRFGPEKTDRFIKNFNRQFSSSDQTTKLQLMTEILKNLFKYSYLLDDIGSLMSANKNSGSSSNVEMWKLLQNEKSIVDQMVRLI